MKCSCTSHAATTRNVMRVFRTATAAQVEAGLSWYQDAHEVASALAVRNGTTLDVATGVIAATSPCNSWGANVNLAGRILATGETSRGYLGTGLRKCRAILDGAHPLDVLRSHKIHNFHLSIMSAGTHPTAVCVDRHAMDIAWNVRHEEKTRPSLTSKRYREIAECYRRAAKIASRELGRPVSPAQIQAITWLAWRRRYWSEGAFDSYEVNA